MNPCRLLNHSLPTLSTPGSNSYLVDLPPDVAARLAQKAARGGQDVAGYMQQLAARDAGLWDADSLTAWDALIDSFDKGEPEDHQATVAVLARGLNEDHPGQRRVFGTGYNPSLSSCLCPLSAQADICTLNPVNLSTR